jgi:hypothetical protein
MLIKTIEEADQIVNHSKDLKWVGWDIVSWKKDSNGFSNKNGRFINNQWGIQSVYPITEKGWHLPNRYAVTTND